MRNFDWKEIELEDMRDGDDCEISKLIFKGFEDEMLLIINSMDEAGLQDIAEKIEAEGKGIEAFKHGHLYIIMVKWQDMKVVLDMSTETFIYIQKRDKDKFEKAIS